MDEKKQIRQTNDDLFTRREFWGTISLAGILLLVSIYYLTALLQQPKTPAIYIALTIFLLSILACAASVLLVIRRQKDAGSGALFYTTIGIGITAALLFQGRTTAASLSVLVIASITIWWLLPRQSWRWYAGITAAGFLLSWVMEWINPSWRILLAAPSIGPAAAVIFGVILVVVVAFQAWKGNLRTKLIMAFLVVTVIPLAIMAFVNDRSSRQSLTNNANTALLSAASSTAVELDSFITNNLDVIRTQANLPDISSYITLTPSQRIEQNDKFDNIASILSTFARQNPIYISSVAIYDLNGITLADTFADDINSDKSDRSWFQKPMETGLPFASDLEFSQTTGEASIYFSAPVRETSGKIVGVIRTRYNAAVLQDIVSSNNNLLGQNSFAVLMDAESHIRLAHGTTPSIIFKSVVPMNNETIRDLQLLRLLPPGSPEEFSTNLPDFEAALENYDKAQPYFVAELKINDNTLEQGAIVTMKTQNWHVVYAQGQDTFLASINTQARNNILLALVIGVVVALFGLYMAQTLAGPIVRLTQTAEAIAGGDIDIQAKVETSDEIGTLAGTFNRMTQQLRDFIATLESRVAERTQNLELAAEVGRTVSQVRALDVMLTEAAELIRTQFDLYYVQVYLVNPSQTYLDLQAGTGHVGEELLGRKHRLPFNTGSINGRAAVGKKSVVIKDTALSTTFRPNPLLPNTHSEIAVPLIIGDKVVGVLDVQSEYAGTLDDVLPAFEALAGQLAIAIQNANFLAETQQARADVEAQAQRQTRTNWAEYLDAVHKPEETGFVFEQNKISPLTREVKIKDNALVTPISVTGEALGNLVVEMEGQSPIARTDELLNTVARQVSQHIESLRLLESADRFRYEAEQASRRLTHEGWQEYSDANAAKGTGYIYDQNEVRPSEQNEIEQAEEAGTSLPLKVRDEVIGKLVLQGLDANDSEAVGIANAVAERLGAHIEGLRLAMQTEKALSTTKKQAQREQALRQITSAVRGSTDPATILRTAARELGTLLGRQTIIQLETSGKSSVAQENEPVLPLAASVADGGIE